MFIGVLQRFDGPYRASLGVHYWVFLENRVASSTCSPKDAFCLPLHQGLSIFSNSLSGIRFLYMKVGDGRLKYPLISCPKEPSNSQANST